VAVHERGLERVYQSLFFWLGIGSPSATSRNVGGHQRPAAPFAFTRQIQFDRQATLSLPAEILRCHDVRGLTADSRRADHEQRRQATGPPRYAQPAARSSRMYERSVPRRYRAFFRASFAASIQEFGARHRHAVNSQVPSRGATLSCCRLQRQGVSYRSRQYLIRALPNKGGHRALAPAERKAPCLPPISLPTI
jgi:hypothetical protein